MVAPRYLGAEGRVPDAGRVSVDVADTPMAIAASLALTTPGAVRDVPARHRGGGSGKSGDLTNALIVLLDEPSYATGAAAGPGGDVVVVGPSRTSPSLRLMINRGRNGMKTRTSAVVPALSHTSW